MKYISSDLTIIGGGITGVCAAISAARLGISVSLINDRPVLGGNSSSEFRVWVSGAQTGWNRYARETGILEELLMRNHYINPDGNPHIWDSIVLDAVSQEENISLYLNTYINNVTMSQRKITAVSGFQMRTHEEYKFTSPLYLDSTGDGAVAFLAGASFRMGREGKAEYGESLAPNVADEYTMGNTIFFYTKDMGRFVPFHRPAFAASGEELSFLEDRFRGPFIDERASGCDYWWFEYGGVLDTIQDDHLITTKIQSLVWGIWDYIKNSGKFEADNLTLEWIGSLSGKRESRRFMGDYVLTQVDLETGRRFPDAVGYGGWPIDIHPPKGIYSTDAPCHQVPVGIYDIPYRTLYSKDVDNLFVAGRCHSASRVAFSSTRVMSTCGVMGQAVGTAAFIGTRHNLLPREIGKKHMEELQQLLLKEDAYIIGKPAKDSKDLAPGAQITASSERKMENVHSDLKINLHVDHSLVLPLSSDLDELNLLLATIKDTHLEVEVYNTERPESYNPAACLGNHSVFLEAGDLTWHTVLSNVPKPEGGKLFIKLKANPLISIGLTTSELTGVISLRESTHKSKVPGVLEVPYELLDGHICFRMSPTTLFTADSVTNGVARPYGNPNMWSSTQMGDEPEWLSLTWDKERKIEEVRVTFNTDLNKRFINLKASSKNVFPQTVKDYDIQIKRGHQYETICSVRGNYQRLNVHRFAPVTTNEVRILIYTTNGSSYAEVFAVRIY